MTEVLKVVYPGMIVMWVMFIAPSAFHDLYEERRRQTLHRLVVSSATLNEVILSKILRSFILCFCCFWVLIIVSWLLQGMKWGNLLSLSVMFACTTFAITGEICFICSVANSKKQLDALIPIFVMFSGCAGGSMVPIEQLPVIMQKIGVLTINYWGILGLRQILDAKSFSTLIPSCLILFFVGLVFTSIGLVILKKRFQEGVLE